jgi:hypothetical protein
VSKIAQFIFYCGIFTPFLNLALIALAAGLALRDTSAFELAFRTKSFAENFGLIYKPKKS